MAGKTRALCEGWLACTALRSESLQGRARFILCVFVCRLRCLVARRVCRSRTQRHAQTKDVQKCCCRRYCAPGQEGPTVVGTHHADALGFHFSKTAAANPTLRCRARNTPKRSLARKLEGAVLTKRCQDPSRSPSLSLPGGHRPIYNCSSVQDCGSA